MPGPLYLDTARLGLMTPAARLAYEDFIRFAGEEGLSPRAEDLLRDGATTLTAGQRERLPHLAGWPGIAGFEAELRRIVRLPPAAPVLVGSRTRAMMRVATRLLFRFCRHVLTADLAWPPYMDLLRAEAARTGNRVTAVPLRDAVFRGEMAAVDVRAVLGDHAAVQGCDGLFLPAVSHDGVRLPVREIVGSVNSRVPLRFVAVDGAQAFAHVPVDLSGNWCDLFLAGCHKWVGAYHPLGIGFCGRPSSYPLITDAARAVCDLDDPLLSLLAAMKTGRADRGGETVNVGPLFSCQGALRQMSQGGGFFGTDAARDDASAALREAVVHAGWKTFLPHESLRSGIALASRRGNFSEAASDAEWLRRALYRRGIAVTAYAGETVRLSAPSEPLAAHDRDAVVSALRSVA